MSETREQKRARIAELAKEVWPGHEVQLSTRDDFEPDDEVCSVVVVTEPDGEWAQVLVLDVPDVDLALDATEAALNVLKRGRT